ncbi:isocitrate dehydrogenase [Ehrlichia chaffeensis str. Heartland]|uniref:Isocitrate dehydrogenase [NADP] n=1 Tax=Ehrlichia chaffeensis (strain ATCC CRL-10679 / Arkansas) TaxID=205920 RepID=Q2GF85_EHRCR|nr:isocitrate dehydrogenase [Ehrlichia chaffeensis]ABD45001.1 dehydrogenase, isocitrate/isopropylmalate family [Ehrlichia chaffeensis str. Arkansas]AHX03246.1 isocitrate dehydrogenase [Ehrlichia chaffeensis str. Heartland]AHX05162.1 isocitrate dehydrogenase [Ehrlichia chaffeensis str. Jax]AHX06151.1 isocitrate dehydrogenase [Ehrlichia chaffeensis str. Liberty]AHX07200.1 isocitrate dehydrogenase [Ehrlichia chaffeensis str. Osceola]
MSIPITVAYGDGIGPEIMEAVLLILSEAESGLVVETIEVGHNLYKKEWSSGIAPSSWDSIYRTKVLLKSPTMTPQGRGHKSLNVTLRKRLGLYANIRPCISYHPVIKTRYPNLNVVIVRENEEDTYTGIEHRLTNDTYQCSKVITRSGSERICDYAFHYAKVHNRKRVTCLIKDNIMKMTDGIFHKSFSKIAENYPDIESDHYIVDIGMAKVASNPENFDVIVTTNLYGDIVSDIVAELSGSIGLAGSANIGNNYAMFEAVHGSAPDIAGKNIANPSGLLNAAIQMLMYLKQFDKAQLIYNAFLKTLEDGIHTADIYQSQVSKKKVSTMDFAKAVVENFGQSPSQLPKSMFQDNVDRTGVSYTYEPSYVTRVLVGVDITIGCDGVGLDFKQLINNLQNITHDKLELVLIHNKGLEIWPDESVSVNLSYMDQVCCRFYMKSKDDKIMNEHINQLLFDIEQKKIDVVKMEKLYLYNDQPGFFTM